MPRPAADMRAWARLGAHQRLQQLDQERQAILRTFPELRRGLRQAAAGAAAAPGGRRRRRRRGPMSAAQKRALSLRMKKIWAERKKKQG